MSAAQTNIRLALEPGSASSSVTLVAAAAISPAISLKRIADALSERDCYGQTGSAAISSAVRDGIRDGRP